MKLEIPEIYKSKKKERIIKLACGCLISRNQNETLKDKFIKVCQKHAYKDGRLR